MTPKQQDGGLVEALKEISALADKAFGMPFDYTARCGDIAKAAIYTMEASGLRAADVKSSGFANGNAAKTEASANTVEQAISESYIKHLWAKMMDWGDANKIPIPQMNDLFHMLSELLRGANQPKRTDYICEKCGKRCWFAAPHDCDNKEGERQ